MGKSPADSSGLERDDYQPSLPTLEIEPGLTPPILALHLARATGLEPATSGVTGRAQEIELLEIADFWLR